MIHLWFAHCHCGSHALAGDPGDDTSEPDGGADVRALWAAREGDRLYFRIDIAQAQIEPLITGLVAAHFVIADDAASGTVVSELRAFATGLGDLLRFDLIAQSPPGALSGLSYPTVRRVIDRYQTDGMASVKPAARGSRRVTGDASARRRNRRSNGSSATSVPSS